MPFPKEDAVAVTQIAVDSSGPELLYYDWKKRDIYARMLSADHRFKGEPIQLRFAKQAQCVFFLHGERKRPACV